MISVKGYIRLMRPANLPTAAADIFAGVAISGVFANPSISSFNNLFFIDLIFIVMASVFLYAGGVVLNDVFDLEIDKIERPERAIPSGLISLKSATIFGVILLVCGILFALKVSVLSSIIALILAAFIVFYDYYAKHKLVLGPISMGLCRGLNLLLGISILGTIHSIEFIMLPILYIGAITLISKGEVHGANKRHLIIAGGLYAVVVFLTASFIFYKTSNFFYSLPFLILLVLLIYKPLLRAYKDNSPLHIKKAVISGVLSLIVLDAIIVVGFLGFTIGILILLLLPLSIILSKFFAVT